MNFSAYSQPVRHSATLIPPLRETSDGEDIRLGIGLDILTIAQLVFAARNAAGFWRPANLTCYFTRRHSVNPSILKRKTSLPWSWSWWPASIACKSMPLILPRFSETSYRTAQRHPVLLWRRNESASELAVVARVELVAPLALPRCDKPDSTRDIFDNRHSFRRIVRFGRALRMLVK